MTLRRIRAHAALIAVALWSVFVWDYSTPGLLDRNALLKGTDFLHFYTLGTVAREGRADELYDIGAQTKLAVERVPAAKGLIYLPLYGPQLSLLFEPLAALPYGTALLVWLALNTALYAACCWLVWRRCPSLRDYPGTVALAAAAFPAFFHLLTWGQTSGLALFAFTLMFLGLRCQNKFAAGLAFGLLFFKPQLAVAGFVIFVLAGEWKILAGAAFTSFAQVAVGWSVFGRSVMRDYLASLWRIPENMPLLEPKLYQLHSLRGLWELAIPWPRLAAALIVVSIVVTLGVAFRTWQTAKSLELRFSALLLATILVSPHLTIYDLVILAPIYLLLTDWAILFPDRSPSMGVLLYFCFVLPLAGPLARWTHVQLTVIAMLALLFVLEQAARGIRGDAEANLN